MQPINNLSTGYYKRILERENAMEILERITPENFLPQTLANAK